MDLTIQENTGRNKIHPYKFAMWVGCGSLLMMFASLTSAYVVRQAAGNWLEFSLPDIFKVSTAVILLSSVTLHSSYLSYKRGKEQAYKLLLVASFILGLSFFVFQYLGWEQMAASGVPFTINPSGDFVYVISWIHAAHVLGGIAALAVALIHAFGLKFKVTEKRRLRFDLTLTYWHFVDLLWVYLFLFLTLYR
ncbi:MAG: cytochrome c oxidase subunit 3 [Lewinellaceae bacterium]|nr:cytochrome c oxidase subunit 3 [Saprospiraceae bacterium]MCB9336513.1 cytochrome c oxidase subunit 3 [Lewinellaceae bacterium]